MASAITYHPPLAPTEIQRQIPSVGAVCGKVARTALCGGREVTCVPTATAHAVNSQSIRSCECVLCPRVPASGFIDGVHGATNGRFLNVDCARRLCPPYDPRIDG